MNCAKKSIERVREVQHKERCEFKKMKKKKHTPSKRRRSSKKKLSKCALNKISRLFRMGLDYFGTRRIENIFFSIVRFKKKLFIHCSLPFKLVQCVCVYVILFFAADVECLLFCINFSI